MAFITGKALTALILGLGPIALDVSQLIRQWMKKESVPKDDIPSRLHRIEKNMEVQSQLNEQYFSEMRILKPALEGMQKSLKLLFLMALAACILSLAAIVLALAR